MAHSPTPFTKKRIIRRYEDGSTYDEGKYLIKDANGNTVCIVEPASHRWQPSGRPEMHQPEQTFKEVGGKFDTPEDRVACYEWITEQTERRLEEDADFLVAACNEYSTVIATKERD